MSKNLDFTGGDDSGEASEDAISPVENGENAVEEVFNRPTHSVRLRSEILRGEANHRRWVDDADRAGTVSLSNPGSATWGGSLGEGAPPGDGELVLTGTLLLHPKYTPGVTRGDYFEDVGALWPTRLAHFLSDNGTPGDRDIQWVSKKYDFEGGNEISVTVLGIAAYGATTVVVNGDGTVADPGVQPGQDDIVVTFDSTAGVPVGVDDIISAINGDSIANQLVVPTYAPGNVDPITDPAYDITTTKLSGGIDGVHHIIPAASLATFFATSAANLLNSGDTLAIWYATPLQRRRSIEETAENIIPAASLVNLTREPDKAPNSVIIGRANGDSFEFAHGAVIQRDIAYSAISLITPTELDLKEDEIRDDYERPIAAPPTRGTLEGSKRLGVDAAPFTALSVLSESQQEVNEDIDTEFSAIQGVISPTGTGTTRVESLASAFPEVQPGNDDLKATLDAIYARLQSHDSLQDLIEASYMTRDGAAAGTKRFPQFLSRDAIPAGSLLNADLTAGDWSGDVQNFLGWNAISADGRYVCIPAAETVGPMTENVSIYNAKDLTVFATVTLTSVPVQGITAIASDGFSLAVAYDSKIEMFDLTAGPPAKDATWATSGIFTHSGTATDHIVDLHFQNQALYYAAHESDGAGSAGIAALDNLVFLSPAGLPLVASAPIAGDPVAMDVYGEYVAYVTDLVGSNLGVSVIGGVNFTNLWAQNYSGWNALHDIAINESGVALSGLNTGVTDAQIDFLTHRKGELISEETNIPVGNYDRVSLSKTKNQWQMCATEAGGNALFRGYEVSIAQRAAGAALPYVPQLWEFTAVAGATQFYWGIDTDGSDLFVLRLNTAGAAEEQLSRYSMGSGAGFWVVLDRTPASADWLPMTAYPLGMVSVYKNS